MSTYFCGIGGIGMSALARLLLSRGEKVLGSDQSDSPLLSELESEGARIFRTQKAEHIPSHCTELIYSEAIAEGHPERQEAKKRGIAQLSYFRKLGKISQDFLTICVAGTHGKSTTTAMAGLALEDVGMDPTVIVGTKVFEWGKKNFRAGKSNILVVEACEYRESFLFLKADIVVLTNLEPDHLDYYKTAENYFAGFRKFIAKLQTTGTLIADVTDPNIQRITHKYPGKEIYAHQYLSQVPSLALPGGHLRENASKVLALFEALGLDPQKAEKSLSRFRGTWRRFELKGEKNGRVVMDDYAHHPTEIVSTLESLVQSYPGQKKWVVFQPHQYSRTAEFLEGFGKSFGGADEILVPNIYQVRDSKFDIARVSPEMLVAEIAQHLGDGQRVRYTENFEKTVEILRSETMPGDVVMTMGAGPVHEVGEELLLVL